jgi:uridylate kinase
MKKIQRVLLKISGEALKKNDHPLESELLDLFVEHIRYCQRESIQMAIVVGGGNFWRGAQNSMIDRSTSDSVGMLATVMNGLVITRYLQSNGIAASIWGSFEIVSLIPAFSKVDVLQDLAEGKVTVLVGGTGSPYFTTDSCAVLRALELECDLVLKATKVNGVYDQDPIKNPQAHLLKHLSFEEAQNKKLGVMDQTAFTLASEHHMPMVVFSFYKPDVWPCILNQTDGDYSLVS